MFGDGLTQDIAILGKDEVMTQGSDSLDTLKQIMDGKLKKLSDREDFAKTVASIPPESCGFCLVHLTGLVEFGIVDGADGRGSCPFRISPSSAGRASRRSSSPRRPGVR